MKTDLAISTSNGLSRGMSQKCKRRPRLAIVTTFLGIGGVENAIYTLANFLKATFELHFVTRCSALHEVQARIRTLGRVVNLVSCIEIYDYLRCEKIDVAYLINARIDEEYSAGDHGLYSFLSERGFPYLMWDMNGEDLLSQPAVTINPERQGGGWIYLPDPVDLAVIESATEKRLFSRDRIVVGIATRLSRIKNLETLIAAVGSAQRYCPALCLLIIGVELKVDDGGVPYTNEEVVALFEQHLASGSYRLFATEDFVPYIKGMDIAALSSRSEGLPIFLLEAAACGKPIVATDVGYIRDMVVPDFSGFLVNSEDHSEFAEALLALASQVQLREKLGHGGRILVRAHDVKGIGPRYRDLFLSLIAEVPEASDLTDFESP